MKFLKLLCVVILLTGCKSEDDPNDTTNLSQILSTTNFEVGAVIACAASEEANTNQVNVYFLPEENATNFRLYETASVEVNPNDFSNYTEVFLEDIPFFNGFLRQYPMLLDNEKWVIVTFQLDNEIKVSNPIRTKQISKPSSFNQQIQVNQSIALMPQFSWIDNQFEDNAIYFQVVSDIDQNVFSATYTFESNFQYYNTSNVVLNVTQDDSPELVSGLTYNFTLMDVSEDNWVNAITLNTNFTVE